MKGEQVRIMTDKEAISQLNDLIEDRKSFYCKDGGDEPFRADAAACRAGIKALNKQIRKKPIRSADGIFFACPECRRYIRRHEQEHGNIDIPYCKWCGQALKWR